MSRYSDAVSLDGRAKFNTLRSPMKSRAFAVSLCLGGGLLLVQPLGAAVVYKAGEKMKYIPPGEEQMSGNAEQLFHIGQTAEGEHNFKRAIKAYKTLVRKHPRDALAPGALYRAAELSEQINDTAVAALLFRGLVGHYPNNPHFEEAIEAQFRIGEAYLAGKKHRVLGVVAFGSPNERAIEIFAAVIRTAPYGKYTARAQYDIGLAREKEHLNDSALEAYQAVVDKFPTDPLAAAAQYQIGYIWFTTSKAGTRDLAATQKARTAFQDFLFRYPNSEKAPQARANLQLLEHKQMSSAYDVAKFYDKQKHYRAAVIYYNEVIREQPGSPESEKAKKRIDELRAKLGDAVNELTAEKKKPAPAHKMFPAPPPPTAHSGGGPLPPPETDLSLPPPSSIPLDTTSPPSSGSAGGLAPGTLGSDSSTSPEPSPSPAP